MTTRVLWYAMLGIGVALALVGVGWLTFAPEDSRGYCGSLSSGARPAFAFGFLGLVAATVAFSRIVRQGIATVAFAGTSVTVYLAASLFGVMIEGRCW